MINNTLYNNTVFIEFVDDVLDKAGSDSIRFDESKSKVGQLCR